MAWFFGLITIIEMYKKSKNYNTPFKIHQSKIVGCDPGMTSGFQKSSKNVGDTFNIKIFVPENNSKYE